jgi:hypothetical protein
MVSAGGPVGQRRVRQGPGELIGQIDPQRKYSKMAVL